MGILTKPDRPEPGSLQERMAFDVVYRNESRLQLGWHVLRNRDHISRDVDAATRDSQEHQLFKDAERDWSFLPAESRGVEALRMRLSGVLFRTITQSLPELTDRINTSIQSAKARLQALGNARPQRSDQLRYLNSVFTKVNQLILQGLRTDYDDDAFFDGTRGSLILSHDFAQKMQDARPYHVISGDTAVCGRHSMSISDSSITFDTVPSHRCMWSR